MNKLFITGMGRSGTTLLDKLLSNHTQIHVLSQPFPMLFVEVKKYFLETRGIKKYYVLNDDFNEMAYSNNDFSNFINSFNFSKEDYKVIFDRMDDYSGQYTKRDSKIVTINKDGFNNFLEMFNASLDFFSFDKKVKYIGVKETICEEYLPYFCMNKVKNILILRDPRDVLASANYPKGAKHFGLKKPSLFILKTWRKSVEFMRLLAGNENFHFLKYEDLVANPYKELDKITKFLNVENFKNNYFENGIFDQKGKLWSANSSYQDSGSFISQKSVGAFKNILSEDEITYTEVICKKEMSLLGYNFEMQKLNEIEIIQQFKDYNVENHQHLPANFSSQRENILSEIHRITN